MEKACLVDKFVNQPGFSVEPFWAHLQNPVFVIE